MLCRKLENHIHEFPVDCDLMNFIFQSQFSRHFHYNQFSIYISTSQNIVDAGTVCEFNFCQPEIGKYAKIIHIRRLHSATIFWKHSVPLPRLTINVVGGKPERKVSTKVTYIGNVEEFQQQVNSVQQATPLKNITIPVILFINNLE